jgi:hypothetical protein
MDKDQEPSNSECCTPSSEPFRFYYKYCIHFFINKVLGHLLPSTVIILPGMDTQLCECGHGYLGKLHHCLGITCGSSDAPDYLLCPCTHCNNLAKKANKTNRIPQYCCPNHVCLVTMLEPGTVDCKFASFGVFQT